MKKDALMFLAGGAAYPMLEVIWRGYSHYSMAIAGGLSLCLINKLCCGRFREKRLYTKCALGSGIITGIELATGILFNKILLMNVWDYSMLPLNILGQICLPFSAIWFFLTIPAIYICNRITDFIDRKPQITAEEH